jgi:anti-sigma regulatory factor (Ser/Thr protein kinase)
LSLTHIVIPVTDSSQVSEARRAAAGLAREKAMNETIAAQLAIVVTEAATNVLKHGGGGSLLLAAHQHSGIPGIQVLALDKGPGMADVQRCLADGYSTAGSPGNGLGAIRRLAVLSDVYSGSGLGVVLMAWLPNQPVRSSDLAGEAAVFETGAVCAAVLQEQVSGDAWMAQPRPGGMRVVVADGLGHGPSAAHAAHAAIDVASRDAQSSGSDLIESIHAALRPTRGAAVAAADINLQEGAVHFTGLGNIAGSVIMAGARRQMVSHNGTAGHQARKIQEFTYSWDPGSLLILHSDGIATHWSLDKYPGLMLRHASVIAGLLFRDFSRGRDDACIVVVRQRAIPEVKF